MTAKSENEMRQRLLLEDGTANLEKDNELFLRDMPYGSRVYMARKKKADSWYVCTLEVCWLELTLF